MMDAGSAASSRTSVEPGDAAPIDVAVGVLIARDGSFLLAQRPQGKPMAGYWEFPGGKLEPGESVFDALVREFDEELGMHVVEAHPWARCVVAYRHATVRLHFWRSFEARGGFTGEAHGREGQAFRWERIDALTAEPWLPGALPVKRWMRLPALYAISNAGAIGVDAFVDRLKSAVDARAIEQLQLREPSLDARAFASLFDRVMPMCRDADVRVLVNSAHAARYWTQADGVHLTSRALRDHAARGDRPAVDWCLASCHDADELDAAATVGCDAVVLGPVKPTSSHPDASPLEWHAFSREAAHAALPVYAIGGLERDDLADALAAGAHGIAMIRGAWQ